jgi:hypothetical protein
MNYIPHPVMGILSEELAGAFTRPTFIRFVTLVLAAILTVGSRTVSNMVRTVRNLIPGHVSSYNRVFSKRRWSTWAVAHGLCRLLLKHLVPMGTVHLAGDDTVDEHRGAKVFGKDRHRDAVHSSRSFTAFYWGHKWVVLSIIVRLPFSRRPWALPVLIALYRSRKWNHSHGRIHRTQPEILESLLKVLMRWFPGRCFRLSADGGFGTHRMACFSSNHQAQLAFVSRFYPDANLHEPCPARVGKVNGRPRLKGRKALSPEQVVEQTQERRRMTVNWYGGEKRDIEIVSAVGHWFKQGQGLVPVRWVFVHDLTGTHRDEYFFTTRIHMPPRFIVEAYTERWAIEVTFEEARAYLGFGSTRCYSEKAVLREAPFLLWLYSIIVLLYVMLPTGKQAKIFVRWQGKSVVTFSDVITGLRRWLWVHWAFANMAKNKGFQKLSRSFRNMLLDALAPAA